MAKKAQATVEISARNKLKAGLQDATKELGNFSKVVEHLGKLTIGAGIGLALKKTGDAAKYCIDEFAKIEPVQRRLKAALKQGTRAYDEAQNTIAKYSKQTLQAGDDVTALVAKLAQLGKSSDEIDDITHACVALSNVTGNDLNSSLGNLLDSLNGEVGELKKFVPELANMSKEALKAGNGIQLVIDKFGKLSEEVSKDSFSQTQKNIEDSWSTTSQSIGQILKNDLQGVMDWWAKKSEEIANTFSAMAEHSENQKILSGIKNNYITPEKSHDEYQRGHVIDQEATVKDGIIQAFNGVPTDVLTAELTRIASEYARDNRGADYEYSAEDKLWTETIKKVLWQRNAASTKRDEVSSPYGAVEFGGNVVDGAQAAKDGKKAQIEAARASKEASEKLITSAQELTNQYSKYLAPRTDEEKIDALVDERNTLDSKLQELIKDGKGNSQEAKNLQRIIDGIDLDIDDLNQKIVDKLQEEIDEQQRLAEEQAAAIKQAADEARKKAEAEAKNLQNIFFKYNPEESKKAGFQTELDAIADKLKELGEKGLQNTDEYKDLIDLQGQVFKEQQKYLDSLNKSFSEKLGSGITDSWNSINGNEAIDDSILGSLMGSFEELFTAIQPIMQMIENPVWTMIAEIAEGFVSVIAPAITETIQPFFDALNMIGKWLGELFLPIFDALYPYFLLIAQILQTTIAPVLQLLAPIMQIVALVLDTIRPILVAIAVAFEVLMAPVKWLADLFNWFGSWIKYAGHCIDTFVYNLAHPFRKRSYGSSPGAFKSDAFSGLDERIAKITELNDNTGAITNSVVNSNSTQTAVQGATYNGAMTININNNFYAPVVGEDGMEQFVIMIRTKFEELEYFGN